MTVDQFDRLEAEREDALVRCASCGEERRCSDMGITMDETQSIEKGGEDVIIRSTRRYVCGEECALEQILGDVAEAEEGSSHE